MSDSCSDDEAEGSDAELEDSAECPEGSDAEAPSSLSISRRSASFGVCSTTRIPAHVGQSDTAAARDISGVSNCLNV